MGFLKSLFVIPKKMNNLWRCLTFLSTVSPRALGGRLVRLLASDWLRVIT